MLQAYQAYIDSSTAAGKVMVMAGYIAPAESWARLADCWGEMLGALPPLQRPFKMKNMSHNEERLEKASWFYRIIERHVTAAISCAVRIDDLHNVWDSIVWPHTAKEPEQLRNPYWTAYISIVGGLVRHQVGMGLEEPIDLIFDNDTEKTPIISGWDTLKATAAPQFQKLMGDTPIFRCDDKVLPLQAADLYAWWVRKWQLENIADWWLTLPFPWGAKRKDFPTLHVTMPEPDIRLLLMSHLERAQAALVNRPSGLQ